MTGAAIDRDALHQPGRPADQRDPEDLALEHPGLRREHDHLRHRFPGGGVLPHRDVRAFARECARGPRRSSRVRRAISRARYWCRAQARARRVALPERQPSEQHDHESEDDASREKGSSCRASEQIHCSGQDHCATSGMLEDIRKSRLFSPAGGTDSRCAGRAAAVPRGARGGSRARARLPPSRARRRRMHRPRAAQRREARRAPPHSGAR